MEYTKNYKLPQWAETDRIQMEDFNEAMEKIEEGLSEAKYVVGQFTVDSSTEKSKTMYECPFEIVAAIIYVKAVPTFIQAGRTEPIYVTGEVGSGTPAIHLQVVGNRIVFALHTTNATGSYQCRFIAFRK